MSTRPREKALVNMKKMLYNSCKNLSVWLSYILLIWMPKIWTGEVMRTYETRIAIKEKTEKLHEIIWKKYYKEMKWLYIKPDRFRRISWEIVNLTISVIVGKRKTKNIPHASYITQIIQLLLSDPTIMVLVQELKKLHANLNYEKRYIQDNQQIIFENSKISIFSLYYGFMGGSVNDVSKQLGTILLFFSQCYSILKYDKFLFDEPFYLRSFDVDDNAFLLLRPMEYYTPKKYELDLNQREIIKVVDRNYNEYRLSELQETIRQLSVIRNTIKMQRNLFSYSDLYTDIDNKMLKEFMNNSNNLF